MPDFTPIHMVSGWARAVAVVGNDFGDGLAVVQIGIIAGDPQYSFCFGGTKAEILDFLDQFAELRKKLE